jgi:hypothetical protein
MSFSKTQSVALSIMVGVVLTVGILSLTDTATARPMQALSTVDTQPMVPSNPTLVEIARRYRPMATVAAKTSPQTEQDVEKVRELFKQNALASGLDFYNAAIVLGSSNRADDALLGEEAAMAATAMGVRTAGPVLAWTHDRYMVLAGSSQRFGTLETSGTQKVAATVSKDVTDRLRKALGVRTLGDAKLNQPVAAIPQSVAY